MEVTMRFFSDAEKTPFAGKKEYSMQEILCVQKSCRRMPAAMNHFYLILNWISGAFSVPGSDL